MNNATLCGNLGNNWELLNGEYGTIAKNSIAITKRYTRDGKNTTRTQWIPLVAFGKQGEILSQYSKKGDKLLVRGEIYINDYETNTGETRTSVSVRIEEFNFIGSKNSQANEKETTKTAKAQVSDTAVKEQEYIENSDTIPF